MDEWRPNITLRVISFWWFLSTDLVSLNYLFDSRLGIGNGWMTSFISIWFWCQIYPILPCELLVFDDFSVLILSLSNTSLIRDSGFEMDEWLRLYLFGFDVDGAFIRRRWDLSVRYEDGADEDGDTGSLVFEFSGTDKFDLVQEPRLIASSLATLLGPSMVSVSITFSLHFSL